MERKTKVNAENGKQEILITREFDLPVDLLFRAFAEPEIVEQWMGTKVLKLESFPVAVISSKTSNPQGVVAIRMNGVYHEFVTDQRITRTFEMENTQFAVQLEFLQFEALTEDTSRLNMHIIFKTGELRDQLLKMPFAQGINFAHNRLQEIVSNLK